MGLQTIQDTLHNRVVGLQRSHLAEVNRAMLEMKHIELLADCI